jgi:hypothetical protein
MDPAPAKKLLLKPGYRVKALNAPEGYLERIAPPAREPLL